MELQLIGGAEFFFPHSHIRLSTMFGDADIGRSALNVFYDADTGDMKSPSGRETQQEILFNDNITEADNGIILHIHRIYRGYLNFWYGFERK